MADEHRSEPPSAPGAEDVPLVAIDAPIDLVFPLGAGQVLVHAGNDLLGFASEDRGTAALRTNLLDWLEAR